MEVDASDGINDDISPAEHLKTKLNTTIDNADAKLCNGDVKPVNGKQNGTHEDEEDMNIDDANGGKMETDNGESKDDNGDSKDDNGDSKDDNGDSKDDNGDSKDCGKASAEQLDGTEANEDFPESKVDPDLKTNGNDVMSTDTQPKVSKTIMVDPNSDFGDDISPAGDKDGVNKPECDDDELQDKKSISTSVDASAADSKPASPSNASKKSDDADKNQVSVKTMTEAEIKCAADVDQRDRKLKRIEDAAKDNDDLRPVAKLLYGIGMDLGAQHIYKDLVRAQTKKQNLNKLDKRGNEQLTKLRDTYKKLTKRNKAYHLNLRSCDKCGFKTESMNVIEWHLEFAHGQDEGKYECSFCDFTTRLPAPFFFHMEAEHNRKGRVFMKKAFFSCPQCPYENNSKTAVARHRLKCDKQFSLKRNQEPLPTDCDIPLKKPKSIITKRMPAVPKAVNPNLQLKSYLNSGGQPSRLAGSSMVRVTHPNPTVQTILSQQQQARPQTNQSLSQNSRSRILGQGQVRPNTQQIQGPGGQMYTLVNSVMVQQLPQAAYTTILPQVRQQQPAQPQFQQPTQNISQIAQQVVAQVTQQHSAAHQQKAIQDILKRAQGGSNSSTSGAAGRAPTIPLTDAQAAAAAGNQKFEICEICGGFVKDRESLRIHFYWAHKVDIQKDVFARLNPHLKCDTCTQAFWTYQGLARHRQISHVKTRERNYRCYLCGAKNIENIITHLSAAHNVKLNTMYKTGKCLVCGLGFAGEKGLKRHIHTAHIELLKGQPDVGVIPSMGKSPIPSPSHPKPTSILTSPGAQSKDASPVPTGLFENAAKKKKFEPVCSLCNIVFPSVESFTLHCNKLHVFKCWRCSDKWASSELLHKHWQEKHRHDVDHCTICNEKVTIGRPYIRHMKRSHLKDVSVVITALSKEKVEFYRNRVLTQTNTSNNKSKKSSDLEIIELSDEDDESEVKVPEQPTPCKLVTVEKTGSLTVKPAGKPAELSKSFLKSNEEVMEVNGEKIVITKLSDDDDENDQDS